MFDLEKAIAAWRRTYEHRRAFFAEDVEELERHVRDHITALVAAGHGEEEAFRLAVQQVGDSSSTEVEYRKVFWVKLKHNRALVRHFIWETTMLKNYLKIALRTFGRHKGYTFINVAGLAVGLACFLLIALYVQDELRYDRFHENADRIVRVQKENDLTVTPTIVAPLFKRTFPEVEEAARLYNISGFSPQIVRYGERVFQEERFFYADSTVFDVLTLPLVAGTPESALNRASTIVISESMAQKYFGDENPMGKLLQVGPERQFEVTGVMEDLPSASHVQFDFLASFASTHWAEREIWGSANFLTYLLLTDPSAIHPLRRKIAEQMAEARAAGEVYDGFELNLVPLTSIYLDFEGHRTYVYLFSAIALLILLIACINYMNLATARAARRAQEVGVRKVSGAHRGQLMRQFYGESALLVVFALAVALALAALALPLFNALSGKSLSLGHFQDPLLLLTLLGIGVVVSLVAGSYPALLLSSFRPAQVLKGAYRTSRGGVFFRKGLVVFQFAISVFLLVATAVVFSQLRYVQTTNLGFDKEQVVVLPFGDRALHEMRTMLKDALLQHANVLHVAAINRVPGYQWSGYGLTIEGLDLQEGEMFPIVGVPADKDAIETLGLELIAGTGFPTSESYQPDSARYVYIVNETTLRQLGWTPEEALGKRMSLSDSRRTGELVGVVKDYHFLSLHEPFYPLAYFIEPWQANHLVVKIAPDDVPGTLAAIRGTWERMVPHRPFEFSFLDEQLDALYRSEQQISQIFSVFAILAVLIACLGLFGLAAYAAEQRTKEIGVRKVLGATVPQIVMLLSKEFTRLVLVAFVVAVPLAYIAMQRWLDSFTFRIDVPWWLFLAAGLATLAIAWLTVSYQSVRAALSDPAKSLRYE